MQRTVIVLSEMKFEHWFFLNSRFVDGDYMRAIDSIRYTVASLLLNVIGAVSGSMFLLV